MVAVLQLKQQRYGYSELFRSSGKKNGHSEKNSRLECLRYSLSTGIYLMPAGNTVCTITWSTAISPPIRRMERMLAPIGLSNAHIHQQLASPGLFGGMLAEPSLWPFSQDATFATALSIFCPQCTSTWYATPGRWRVSLSRNGYRSGGLCRGDRQAGDAPRQNTRTMPSGVWHSPIQTIFFRTLPAASWKPTTSWSSTWHQYRPPPAVPGAGHET